MAATSLRAGALAGVVLAFAGVTSACSAPDPGALPYSSRASGSLDAGAPDTSTDLPPAGPDDAGSARPDASADSAAPARDAAPDTPTGPAVLSVTLVDTSITNVIDGSPIAGHDPIAPSSTFSLGTVGNNLSIRANVANAASIASVGFVYDGNAHTENATPYTLCGDNGQGTITNCNLAAGPHTLVVTPYDAANLGGNAGTPLSIHFTIDP